jgi:hypothetical protein
LDSSKLYKFFDAGWANFENNQILIYKINHRFIVSTRLFTGGNILTFRLLLILEGATEKVLQYTMQLKSIEQHQLHNYENNSLKLSHMYN